MSYLKALLLILLFAFTLGVSPTSRVGCLKDNACGPFITIKWSFDNDTPPAGDDCIRHSDRANQDDNVCAAPGWSMWAWDFNEGPWVYGHTCVLDQSQVADAGDFVAMELRYTADGADADTTTVVTDSIVTMTDTSAVATGVKVFSADMVPFQLPKIGLLSNRSDDFLDNGSSWSISCWALIALPRL